MPGTHVHTTVAKIYRRSQLYYDCTETYRRSQRGYRCSYDCTEIYRRRLAGYASYLRLYRNLS